MLSRLSLLLQTCCVLARDRPSVCFAPTASRRAQGSREPKRCFAFYVHCDAL